MPEGNLTPCKIIGVATAEVRGGKCSNCQEDMTDVLIKVKENREPLPKHCRHCGAILNPDMTFTVYRCGRCNAKLTLQKLQPDRELHCTQCGDPLDYSSIITEEQKVPES